MNLNITFKFRNKEYNLLDLLAVIAIIIVGILLRVMLFQYVSNDYTEYLERWTAILGREGFISLGDVWYNYTPLYMYVLLIISKLPINNLVGIKIFSMIFDLLLAWAAARAAGRFRSTINPLIPFGIVWFTPTIVSNSGMWGQCDSIYAFFIVMCFLCLLEENSFKTMLWFSLAFALKLQSVFFAPVLLLMFFLKKIRFRDCLLIPAVYFAEIIPVWIAGRPLKSCLLIYLEQSQGKEPRLSSNYPNIFYLLMNDAYVELYKGPAILFTISVLLVLMYYVLKKCYKNGINKEILLETALATGTIIVFLLPGMHERYSYVTDLFAIIYGLTIPRKLHIPILRVGVSFLAYTTYFVHGEYLPYEILAAIGIYLIYDSVTTLMKTLNKVEASE